MPSGAIHNVQVSWNMVTEPALTYQLRIRTTLLIVYAVARQRGGDRINRSVSHPRGVSCESCIHLYPDIQSEALQNAHQSVLQLIHLIRLRLLFLHRRWADLPAAIEAFGQEISTLQRTSSDFDVNTDVWHSHLQLHYILYRALWHGRAGDDVAAKGLLKQVYVFVDQIADSGLFKPLRRNGGLLRVSLYSYY